MRFELDPVLLEVREQVRAFALERIASLDPAHLAEGRGIETLWTELTQLGLHLLTVPEEHGGAGMSSLALTLVVEELARADASIAIALALHLAVAEAALAAGASTERPLGTVLDLAPAESGFPLAPGWATRWVVPLAGGWRWIEATETPSTTSHRGALLGLRGLHILHGSIGAETAATAPEAAPVRPMFVLLGLGAAALGAGEAALTLAREYARERRQFGRPIADFQAIQFMLADARTELDAARWTLWRAASDPEEAPHLHAARRMCVRAARRAADHALQIHGGMGYVREVPVERHLRDTLACGAWFGGAASDASKVVRTHLSLPVGAL